MLDEKYRDVARRSLAFVGKNIKTYVIADVFDLYANFSYHRACYSASINNSNIKRAQVRCQHKNKECEKLILRRLSMKLMIQNKKNFNL